jgi:hypothetical protein
MGKPSKRESEMRRILDELRASGQTRREFAKQRGIGVTTLDYWRRRIGRTPRFVQVEATPGETATQKFTVRLANGRAIESSFPLAEQELARLIRIAESA